MNSMVFNASWDNSRDIVAYQIVKNVRDEPNGH